LCEPHKKAFAHSTPQNAGGVTGVRWSHHLLSANQQHTQGKAHEEMHPVTCWHNSTQDAMPLPRGHCSFSQMSLPDPAPQLSNSKFCLKNMLVVSMVIDILPALSPINKQPYSNKVQGTDSQASGPIQNHDRQICTVEHIV
jgi:hypothetical protein